MTGTTSSIHQLVPPFLIWFSTLPLLQADEYDHYEPPTELDVEVYQACLLNNGFGGRASSKNIVVQYYQEITFIGGPSFGTDIVANVDLATVNELLAASRITCQVPPAVVAKDDPENRRELQGKRRHAVGISANPEDAILELDCSEPPTAEDEECVVVDAGFSVFYDGEAGDDNDESFETGFRTALQEAVDAGRLNRANDQIVKIQITDPSTYKPFRNGDNDVTTTGNGDLNPKDSTTLPIVVGALVGSLLLGAAGVAYQRSQKASRAAAQAASGETANTPPPRGNKPE